MLYEVLKQINKLTHDIASFVSKYFITNSNDNSNSVLTSTIVFGGNTGKINSEIGLKLINKYNIITNALSFSPKSPNKVIKEYQSKYNGQVLYDLIFANRTVDDLKNSKLSENAHSIINFFCNCCTHILLVV